jgi:hypothetical protein
MHKVDVRVHHFYVPNRLLWDNWEQFITGGPDHNDSSVLPTLTSTGTNGLEDYYGIPRAGVDYSALPIRGYNAIYNEYYRDQDIVSEVGADSRTVRSIAWEKDYFTKARPWEQKGPNITLPVGSQAPVMGIGFNDSNPSTSSVAMRQSDLTAPTETAMSSSTNAVLVDTQDNGSGQLYPDVYADLSAATAIPITDLREALSLQRIAEIRAQYGSRYPEYIRYAFGVRSSDGRLDRPEYLGGGSTPLSFSEVLQTGPETSVGGGTDYGVADMYGHGIGALRSNRYRRFIEEHGYIHSMLSVRPKTLYADGVQRSFLKTDRNEFFQPELQQTGQQAIWMNELFGDASHDKTTIFGYGDKYDEYKRHPSRVMGDFRSTLNYWHMGRILSPTPALNPSFVECDPTKRIHNVQTEDTLWCMAQHKMVMRRPVRKGNKHRIL